MTSSSRYLQIWEMCIAWAAYVLRRAQPRTGRLFKAHLMRVMLPILCSMIALNSRSPTGSIGSLVFSTGSTHVKENP